MATVQTILDKVIDRIGGSGLPVTVNFLDAANAVLQVITKRLLIKKSDFLREDFTGTVTNAVPYFTLPTGFKGFAEKPYLSGTTQFLWPLPPEARAFLTTAGTPRYYELRGTICKVFPSPTASTTVVGLYYKEPTAFSDFTSSMPFGDLANDIFVEGIIRVCIEGLKIVVEPEFLGMMYSQIEEVLPSRTPRQVTWKCVKESGQTSIGIGSRDYWGV